MKKKIFGGVAMLAIAAVAAFNVNLNSQSDNLSAISLANVEALATETNNCPAGHCKYKTSSVDCEACCSLTGQTPVCNAEGCHC